MSSGTDYLSGTSAPLVARPVVIAIGIAGVRDINPAQLALGTLVTGVVGGNKAKLWWWDDSSVLGDNGADVLRPTAVDIAQPGRFIALQLDFQIGRAPCRERV